MEARHAYFITSAILLAGGSVSVAIGGATRGNDAGTLLGGILVALGAIIFFAAIVPPFPRR